MNAMLDPTPPLLRLEGVAKRFTLHNQNGAVLQVLDRVDMRVHAGECVVLDGPSGKGKSTLLKLIYANYRASSGRVRLFPDTPREIDLASAAPRDLVAVRRDAIGYVSQFLRVIPRVSALDVVAEPLLDGDVPETAPSSVRSFDARVAGPGLAAARAEAARWLQRLGIGRELWGLPPATFSGGEQQRVNIARSLIKPRPVLLLDEPTASLDAANTRIVIDLVIEARSRGAAIVGVFHDPSVADAVATRRVHVDSFRSPA